MSRFTPARLRGGPQAPDAAGGAPRELWGGLAEADGRWGWTGADVLCLAALRSQPGKPRLTWLWLPFPERHVLWSTVSRGWVSPCL